MTFAVAVLVGAAVASWLVPRHLERLDLRRRDPLPVIATWLMSSVGVLLAAASSVALLLVPGHEPGASLLAPLHRCWTALRHGSPPGVEEVAGVVGLVLLAAFAARVAFVVARGLRRRALATRERLAVLRLAGRWEPGSPDILWLANDRPLAFSLTGRRGVVVATDGLTRQLPGPAVAAVLAHERAHLRGRHHLLVTAAESLRAALPFVPLFRRAPAAIRSLVELAADATAVRHHGTAAVRSALLCVSADTPRSALAMAGGAVDLRLARLRHGTTTPGRLRRALSCGLAGLTVTALPYAVGAVLLLGLSLATCHDQPSVTT